MSIADLSRGDQATSRKASSITCPHYKAGPGGKRCRNYVKGGACSRPTELMCTEWLKANGHTVPQDQAATGQGPEPETPAEQKPATDLFGDPVPEQKSPPKSTPKKQTEPAPFHTGEHEAPPPPPGLTTEDIASFKALGVEVCLRSEGVGELWLVAGYTGKDRKEITPEHAATLHHLLQVFPGSQVVSFDKNPNPDKESNP